MPGGSRLPCRSCRSFIVLLADRTLVPDAAAAAALERDAKAVIIQLRS